jgi:hypothetical protein
VQGQGRCVGTGVVLYRDQEGRVRQKHGTGSVEGRGLAIGRGGAQGRLRGRGQGRAWGRGQACPR